MKLRRTLATVTLAAVAAVASPAAGQTNLVVQSDGDCPSSLSVTQALCAIRPDNQWPALVARIRLVDDRVRISLGQDETHWRDVPAPADCGERALRAALVIAVWSAELPAPAIGAPNLSVAVPAPLRASVAPARKSPLVAELGVQGFYGLVGGLSPGAGIELGVHRRDAWWGVRTILAYQSTRSVRVNIGASSYDRALVGAALVLRWDRQRTFLSSDLGMVGSFTRAHGDGYSKNESARAFNLGPSANGRAGLRWGRWRVWTEAGVCRWLAKESFRVDAFISFTTSALASWDAHLGLGAGITFD